MPTFKDVRDFNVSVEHEETQRYNGHVGQVRLLLTMYSRATLSLAVQQNPAIATRTISTPTPTIIQGELSMYSSVSWM